MPKGCAAVGGKQAGNPGGQQAAKAPGQQFGLVRGQHDPRGNPGFGPQHEA